MKMYLNSINVGSTNNTGPIDNGTTTAYIGSDYGTSSYFDGIIDEFKIYSFALTEDEVKLEYNQGKSIVLGSASTDASGNGDFSSSRAYCPPGNTEGNCALGQDPTPIVEWRFDEKTGISAYDTSGGSITGALGSGSSAPTWKSNAFCKNGACLEFDGTNSTYLSSSTDPGAMNTGTYSLWVKPFSTKLLTILNKREYFFMPGI